MQKRIIVQLPCSIDIHDSVGVLEDWNSLAFN